MSQGFAMFDAEHRIIVSNRRFAEIYGLSTETTKPGTALREILEQRIAAGICVGSSAETYVQVRLASVREQTRSVRLSELSDGRVIAITHEPMQKALEDTIELEPQVVMKAAGIVPFARRSGWFIQEADTRTIPKRSPASAMLPTSDQTNFPRWSVSLVNRFDARGEVKRNLFGFRRDWADMGASVVRDPELRALLHHGWRGGSGFRRANGVVASFASRAAATRRLPDPFGLRRD